MSESKIKLVQIIADSALGGGPKHVLGILRNIDQSKFEPFLLCPPGYLKTEAKKIAGVQVLEFDPRSKFDLVAVYLLKRTLEQIQACGDPFAPMIIHSHGPRAGLMSRTVAPYKAKTVYTEHRYDADYHLKNLITEYFQKKIIGLQNRKSDLVIAVSSSVDKFLLRENMALRQNLVVIPNAIDIKDLAKTAPKQIKVANKVPIIGTIGNLNYNKGQTYLVEAMLILKKKYPLITLEIIGEGPEKNDLNEQIKLLKLEHHISLLGQKKDVYKYLRHWDVFVLPSVAETFGIVILESFEAGVPVVASRVGGIPDIVTNKKNGLLIPAKAPKEIAKAISELLDHPVLAANLKRGGKERIKDFDWNVIIKKLESEYLRITSS